MCKEVKKKHPRLLVTAECLGWLVFIAVILLAGTGTASLIETYL